MTPHSAHRADTVREFRGLYETGFEVSWFHPCGAPAGDDTLVGDALERLALRQRDSLAKIGRGRAACAVRPLARHRESEDAGGAGHMGRGSRYMLVTEVLQLRAADESGCTAA